MPCKTENAFPKLNLQNTLIILSDDNNSNDANNSEIECPCHYLYIYYK